MSENPDPSASSGQAVGRSRGKIVGRGSWMNTPNVSVLRLCISRFRMSHDIA